MDTETLVPPARTSSGNNGNGFRFEAADVTGTHLIDARDVHRATPAGAVAQALAARMELPQNVPWALRGRRRRRARFTTLVQHHASLRVLLHLAVLTRTRRNLRWHLRCIGREFYGPTRKT
jgi:hypothetical protein